MSTGTCVKALILNGLGLRERRLYLVSDFFSDKPIEHLLGAGVSAELLNDDRLGRCLDDLYAFGVSKLFSLLAQEVYTHLQLPADPIFYHCDNTSFHLDRHYNSEYKEEGATCVHITQGYSRDHRPDLNFVVKNFLAKQMLKRL